MFPRHIAVRVAEALRDTPVVVLHGARQVGKTTLVRHLAATEYPARYFTMDQGSLLAAAESDPEGLIGEIEGPVILDEIQRAPELLLAIKAAVDRDRRPGRFLLTGSAQLMQIPRLADSLAGRMEVLTLWPLSQGEIQRVREGFVDGLFARKLPGFLGPPKLATGAVDKRQLVKGILAGGYPEAVARQSIQRRRQWFDAYLGSITRDVRDLANIAGLADLPRLIRAVAGRVGGLLNYADLGRDVGLNQITVKRYLALLEATFLVRMVPPWFTNRIKRVAKSPKPYLVDPGLLAFLLDVTPANFGRDASARGMVLEDFVATELWKQSSWSKTRPALWHFRDHRDNEVDFVLEAPGGSRLVGIEVKSRITLRADDFKGLRVLAETAGSRFHRGVVLHPGAEIIPFGPNLHALPLTALWQLGARPVSS